MARVIQTNLDLSKNQLIRARIENLAADPSSPVAGQIYYNTANNEIRVYNATSFVPLASGTTPQATAGAVGTVQLTNDFGGTATAPTVVATHLASALPVSQGGSGAATLTGILIGNGTSAFSTVAAPTGTIVGTSDAQTLTSKTLTTPTINGAALSGTFSGTPTFSGSLTSSIGTITTNTPALTATQTWNTVGTTYYGIFANITNTTSAAASRLIELEVASTMMFSVDTTGNVRIGGSGTFIGNLTGNASGTAANVTGTVAVGNGGTGATSLTGVIIGTGTTAFTTKANPTGAFVGDTDTQTLSSKTLTSPTINGAALSGTLSGTPTFSGAVVYSNSITSTLGTITTNTPTHTSTATWNAGGVAFQGIFQNITNTASAAASRLIDLQVASATMFNVDVSGNTKINGIITAGSGSNAITVASGLLDATKMSGFVPVANGGTGVGTLTGILVGNGTSAFTTVTAPTGAIVGTTDTQTLSGKTLTSPTINAAALSGTLSGTPTFSGVVTFSAQPSVSGTSSATFQLNSLVQVKAASSTEMQVVTSDGTTLANMRVQNLIVAGEITEVAATYLTTSDPIIRVNDSSTTNAGNANSGLVVKRLKADNTTRADVQNIFAESGRRWVQDIVDVGANVVSNLVQAVVQIFTASANGSLTTFAFNHKLNNQWPLVQVVDTTSNNIVETDISYTDADNLSISFAQAPATNSYKVMIVG